MKDSQLAEIVAREQSRLRSFIRRRVTDTHDAEDILQDVFYRLVQANRLLMPIDHVTGWLSQDMQPNGCIKSPTRVICNSEVAQWNSPSIV